MRILLVNNFFTPFGGAENSTNKTGQVLKNNGHEVYFFATDMKPYFQEDYKYSKYFPKHQIFADLNLAKVKQHRLNPSYFYNFEAKNKLDAYLKEIKPDIVHLNCVNYYLSPSIIEACKKNNVPMVMTIRDPFFACPNCVLLYKSEEFCKKQPCITGNPLACIMNKCNDKSLIKSLISASEFAFRRIHKLYDQISIFICTSEAIMDLALRSGIPRHKLVLINNFIDDAFLNLEPEYNNKGYFLFAGRLGKEKGLIPLLGAMKKLPHIPLHIVGKGPEEENLKLFAKNNKMKNINFLGFKRGKDLLEEYKGCIASIIPSTYFEAFGMTILESFSYGKPVIGSNIGGIPEVINNNTDGIIVEPGNINEMAQAINKLYTNKDLVIDMGMKGRAKTENRYNSNIYYSKLISLYNSVLQLGAKENKNENLTYK